MIRQKIGGKSVNTVMATGSADDITSLTSLLEGELETFELKFEGGTVATAPVKLNTKIFSVGKKTLGNQYKSAYVDIPHVKSGKTFNPDVTGAVKGQFDASYEEAVKCEYSNLIYDGME